jgi:hypothetical protein
MILESVAAFGAMSFCSLRMTHKYIDYLLHTRHLTMDRPEYSALQNTNYEYDKRD